MTWSARITSRLSVETTGRICALAGIFTVDERVQARNRALGTDEDGLLAFIKSAPGNVSLESMMTEIRKLAAVRAIDLPTGVFADVAPEVLGRLASAGGRDAIGHYVVNALLLPLCLPPGCTALR
ncbi:hypothetical protein [Nonomuraea jabiensis]|uniref:Uncharacterized protein n=1 Tax=Nonomuraea jabiensis TaxID=882448 RepID=A0A7W9GBJ6_9ACTN|nr:hypothetical protein [Nonomuraea jabiensis]MBB5780752.1 hypothetical protein [Nonomuraea jabiensis]